MKKIIYLLGGSLFCLNLLGCSSNASNTSADIFFGIMQRLHGYGPEEVTSYIPPTPKTNKDVICYKKGIDIFRLEDEGLFPDFQKNQEGAARHDAFALYNLARYYEVGRYVPQSDSTARALHQEAAKQNFAPSLTWLMFYSKGEERQKYKKQRDEKGVPFDGGRIFRSCGFISPFTREDIKQAKANLATCDPTVTYCLTKKKIADLEKLDLKALRKKFDPATYNR